MTDFLFRKAKEIYLEYDSVKAVAKELQISEHKARKILVTQGFELNSTTGRSILELYNQGVQPSEISKALKLSKKYVNSYLPYTKTMYNKEDLSKNAKAIKRHRQRQDKN